MKLIVISRPHLHNDDGTAINRILEHEGFTFHLRKPKASAKELSKILQQLDDRKLQRVVVHDHFELADAYPIKGVCLNKRAGYDSNKAVCQSMHNLDEYKGTAKDYVMLSPVFDSISKSGYSGQHANRSGISGELAEFKERYNVPVIALGGVEPDNIVRASELGFDGVAVLGYLWRSMQHANGIDRIEKKIIRLLAELDKCEPVY